MRRNTDRSHGPGWRLRAWLSLGVALAAVAGAGEPADAMQMASGSYTGTGAASRAVTGAGFRPDAVIIKGNTAQLAVARSATMTGNAAKQLAASTVLQSKRIQSLDADGFTVGASAEVNATGVGYTWVAFRDDGTGSFRAGSYAGSGSDNRSIGGVGFQPGYVIVMSAGAQPAVQRSAAMTGDTSFQFDGTASRSNTIQALQPDGFQVGSDSRVNASGTTYHYLAWKAVAGSMSVGSYAGNGADNRSISGVGFLPQYVLVKGSGAQAGVHRATAPAGDSTLAFTATANASNVIQRFEASGFQVGTASTVNNTKATYFWAAFRTSPASTPATALAISSVNGGAHPVAGTGFPVVVEARDAGGASRSVTAPTAIRLDLKTGSGTLGGTLTGTIPAGASQLTMSGVTYTRAESGVVLTASRTGGDPLTPGDSSAFVVDPGAIASYSVAVSSPQPAGAAFGVTATGRDQFSNPVTTNSSAVVTLTSPSGHVLFDGNRDGTFGDPTGTLSGGAVTMNARSTVAETTSIVATDTAGHTGSAPVTITEGPAAALAFTTQPGNATTGGAIPGPPSVSVRDSFGNPVTSSTASITVALGANPVGGTLAGTTSKSAASGVASFTDLTLNRAGAGYTLTAAAPGLAGATSAPFTVAAATGSASGRVTRASDGAPLPSAVVDALQGGLTKGSTTTSADGSYQLAGLAPGAYDVRASASGYQPQTRPAVTVPAGGNVTADFTLTAIPGATIRITSPAPGSTIDSEIVMVRGELTAPPGATVGVSVNVMPGFVSGSQFAALALVSPTTTTLTASLNGPSGSLATDSIPVTVLAPGPASVLSLRAIPSGGLAPLTVSFDLSARVAVAHVALDVDGDGVTDFDGTTLSGRTFTLAQPGVYPSRVSVTDTSGRVHTTATVVQVFDRAALDQRLQAVWQGLKDALRAGDVTGAAAFVHSESRDRYQAQFSQLSAAARAAVDQIMTPITFVEVTPVGAQYEMLRQANGQTFSYAVWFLLDYDGLWRLRRF